MKMKLLLPLLALVPGIASAHAILIDSTPTSNGKIAAGADTMTLRFNSKIDRQRSRLTLVAPGKVETRLPIDRDGAPDVMVANATLQPGDYVVRWQVLAVDGHITRGDLPFTVVAP